MAAFEIGHDQRDALDAMFAEAMPMAKREFHKDYAGLWRVLLLFGK